MSERGQHDAVAIAELTATEAVAHFRDGSLTAEAYASALLTVCRANQDLNAFTYRDDARVLEAARDADRARSRGDVPRDLAGIPVVVKDNIDTEGFPTSASTAALKGHNPGCDAPVVAALQRRGAYVFAKANMHELAGGGTSSNPTFGAVGNPYDRARVAGGSSGGTAAAIAARMAPLGLGTDTAGSVRIPSAFCGTVALRPTSVGGTRYALDGVVPLAADLDTVGPMARSVADLALMHSAIAGAPSPTPARLADVRIGIPRQHYWEGLDTEVERVTRAALTRLQEAGATLVDVDVSSYLPDTDATFWTLINAGMREDLAAYFRRHAIDLDATVVIDAIASKDTRRLFHLAREASLTGAEVATARGAGRARIGAAYSAMFRAHGLSAIAFPTEPLVAPLISAAGDTFEDEVEVGGKPVSKLESLIRQTRFTCALGVPGLSLAAGVTAAGLPVGLEFDGLAGGDVDLLGLGLAAEAELGRLPPPDLRLGS
ncbi:indole acetimide hydrolase [Bradyrhizobium sp. U87765 SZCCT0131]|uniref:amidase family protein n=1 Tax=unclassified Bradyrhizobium TaxID=2631580 RepID=UPI001BA9EA83|nr:MULTISPECIES: amidase family protein [unclassified Bradyrhizobium]MBR1217626.1 indole acetimide hydrolase [Bradyrhizobium sp. U87765 SZCCT0131]MBR1261428.1 indole acetimide hydrolase [Bradyrhizobium sp. U87765 SZCCT0134]MBR1303124.1 indole acetimide hydrolase [Bradyrhizobium sp. U87765 SZCCT0110]MBR1318730.1 indole acetimide hydrolase [Bradyrhizobium sp. U87765 SZCCT0109]MBR1347055.1 indole acetimide hydrolase [Bradyrhizobium sp. U87765 SZCCT0048]